MSSPRCFSHDKKRRPGHRRRNGPRLKSRICFLVFRSRRHPQPKPVAQPETPQPKPSVQPETPQPKPPPARMPEPQPKPPARMPEPQPPRPVSKPVDAKPADTNYYIWSDTAEAPRWTKPNTNIRKDRRRIFPAVTRRQTRSSPAPWSCPGWWAPSWRCRTA